MNSVIQENMNDIEFREHYIDNLKKLIEIKWFKIINSTTGEIVQEYVQKPIAVIKDWDIMHITDFCMLVGTCVRHPRIESGHHLESSKILNIDFTNNKCETLNTIYELR